MPIELLDKVQQWTAVPRAAVVLLILKGETSNQEVARKYALHVAEAEEWRDRYLMGVKNEQREARVRAGFFARRSQGGRSSESAGGPLSDVTTTKTLTQIP